MSERGSRELDRAERRAWRERLGPDGLGWSPGREARLVERVLAETTRVPPGWRGDLRLVLRFCAERLRGSRALRTAVAASLLAHVAAVPALAWLLLADEPTPAPRIRIELPEASPLEEVVEPARAMPASALDEPRPHEAENALRRGRYLLETRGLPAGFAEDTQPATVRWLARRSRVAAGAPLLDPGEDAWREAGALERVLWAEVLLDAYALRKAPAPWTARVWDDLASEALGGGEEAPLARRTLERAAAYGLADGPFAGVSDGRPLNPGWGSSVARRLAQRGELTEAARAWLAAASEPAGARPARQ